MPPFNLPQPWQPGYTLPKAVRVENLQRRAFVTQQMPRGTYDSARVGDAGYAVPKYVMAEGTGQGVTITKWAPRGTAPRVDHFIQDPRTHLVSMSPASRYGTNYVITSDAQPAPHPFKQYGQNVANHVMNSIKQLPKSQRKPALKSLLDRVDHGLWTRVSATASKAAKAGVPPARALHHAIATNFHSGIMRELAEAGTTGQVKKRSLVGLGCFGCAAIGLGDTAPVFQISTVSLDAAAAQAAADQKYFDDQNNIAMAAIPSGAHWERVASLASRNINPATGQPWVQACGYMWVGPGIPKVGLDGKCPVPRVHLPGDAPQTGSGLDLTKQPTRLSYCGSRDVNGNPITPCDPNVPKGFGQTITIGPFKFPGDATTDARNRWTDKTQVPADILKYIQDQIDSKMSERASYTDDNPFQFWFGYKGYALQTDFYSKGEGEYPVNSIIPQYLNPYNGRQYGLFLFIRPPSDPAGPLLAVRWSPMDDAKKGAWGEIKDTVGNAAGTVGGWVQTAAEALAKAACQAVNQPGSVQAAAADPRAEAGVIVAKGLCGPGSQPTPVPLVAPASTGMSTETMLLIGGAGLAAIYLLTR
jgi:hypothetical protein